MAAALEKEEEGKEEGKEAGSEGSSHGEKEDKATEEESQTPKAPRRPKTMQIKVTLLDDTLYECELEVRNNVVIFCLICETILWVVVGFFFFCVCVCARLCQKHVKGQELFTKVCDHLNLLERDYYGLLIWETPKTKVSRRRQPRHPFGATSVYSRPKLPLAIC